MLGFYDVDNIIVDISTTKVQLFSRIPHNSLHFFHKKGEVEQQNGTHTGVVVATTPVPHRPVHQCFTRKREEGRSFLK